MKVFLNPGAGGGRALSRWERIRPILEAQSDELDVQSSLGELAHWLRGSLKSGPQKVVAAGGDGTVHQVVNAIMQLPPELRSRVQFGAIGLGSSNDFHKPFSQRSEKSALPLRLSDVEAHNVLRCEYEGPEGSGTEFLVINGSLGVVALANQLYNEKHGVLATLKKLSLDAAMTYCALKTMAVSRNHPILMRIGDEESAHELSNLGIVINPHFGGNCRYDTEVDHRSNFMRVNLCEDMNRWRKLQTFRAFEKGLFTGLPGTSSWKCRDVSIRSQSGLPFELDGEVRTIHNLKVSLLQGALQVCSRTVGDELDAD